jgi:hypothetical protein
MKSVHLSSLNELENEVQKIHNELIENGSGKTPELLFRGQADSAWGLTTTLERTNCEGMSFDDYYRLAVGRVRPVVEAFTDVVWEVPNYDTSLEVCFLTDQELFSLRKFPSVEFYRYMVYLRHHGFPSPLLDWTSSMHIAAFFAFRELGAAENRSIYVYCEAPHGFKGGAVGEPAIRSIGRYVRTHARHFRQQSDYTICAAFYENLGGWRFHRHDPVFGSRGRQDRLWKFDLSSTERIPILKSLDEHNLNAFSLFDSQETLLETMWLREQVFAKRTSQMRLPYPTGTLAEILRQRGYETHPKGMAQPLADEIEQSDDGRTAYFDVNADAVRRNGEVPERPIRLTFERASMANGSPIWSLRSIEELAPGVQSKALDRMPETPKRNARWPD